MTRPHPVLSRKGDHSGAVAPGTRHPTGSHVPPSPPPGPLPPQHCSRVPVPHFLQLTKGCLLRSGTVCPLPEHIALGPRSPIPLPSVQLEAPAGFAQRSGWGGVPVHGGTLMWRTAGAAGLRSHLLHSDVWPWASGLASLCLCLLTRGWAW